MIYMTYVMFGIFVEYAIPTYVAKYRGDLIFYMQQFYASECS